MKLRCVFGALALLGLVSPLSGQAVADFKAPVRLMAGEAFLGAGRMYPSPAVFERSAQGELTLVIGDLPGKVTLTKGTVKDGGLHFGKETALLDRENKPLKFHNW